MRSFRKHGDLFADPFSRRSFLKIGIFGAALLALPHKVIASLEEAPAPELITPGWREECRSHSRARRGAQAPSVQHQHRRDASTGSTGPTGSMSPRRSQRSTTCCVTTGPTRSRKSTPTCSTCSTISTRSSNATAPSTSSRGTAHPGPMRSCASETARLPETACTCPGWPSICGCPICMSRTSAMRRWKCAAAASGTMQSAGSSTLM